MKRPRTIVALLIVALLAGGVFLLRASSRPKAPEQPIAFDHWQHVKKADGPQLECTFCHEHAEKNSYATVPNVDTCMVCHQSVETDKPQIQKLTGFSERNEQPRWRRVYWFEPEANVFFSHKPHLKAGVDCASCHGDVANSHQVRREVDQTMGWCIACHRERGASFDCYVCHR
jgi:hypothetical protein